jgi:hypothetical protein
MARKVSALLGSAIFLVIAPGFVAGLAPWWISRWRLEAPFFGAPLFRVAGDILIALGVAGLLDSFVRFALQGIGTPAPVFPTRHLVVTGLLLLASSFGPPRNFILAPLVKNFSFRRGRRP